jgi:hypothetical protein
MIKAIIFGFTPVILLVAFIGYICVDAMCVKNIWITINDDGIDSVSCSAKGSVIRNDINKGQRILFENDSNYKYKKISFTIKSGSKIIVRDINIGIFENSDIECEYSNGKVTIK